MVIQGMLGIGALFAQEPPSMTLETQEQPMKFLMLGEHACIGLSTVGTQSKQPGKFEDGWGWCICNKFVAA